MSTPLLLAAAAQQPHGGMAGFAAHALNTLSDALGGPGAGLANALDSVLPFVPSEVILPLVGVSSGQGHINLVAAIVWCTLGSVVGSLVMYTIGAALGRDRAKALLCRLPLVKPHEVDRTEAWFGKHGRKAVFFGRMIPVFRSLISIPAGVDRMPVWMFALLTGAGSLIWNSLFVVAGYQLGDRWDLVERYAGLGTKVVLVLVMLAVCWFVVSRLRRGGGEARGRHAAPRR